MFLKSGGVASILLIFFVAWVFLADNGQGRLERSCEPVQWVGTIFESIVDLTYPEYSYIVDEGVDSTEYSCQYIIWRIFYEEEWLEYEEEQKIEDAELIKEERRKAGKNYHD